MIPRTEAQLSSRLSIVVYGVKHAANFSQKMEQAYYVRVDGWKIARCLLLADERQLVWNYLNANWPEHAKI